VIIKGGLRKITKEGKCSGISTKSNIGENFRNQERSSLFLLKNQMVDFGHYEDVRYNPNPDFVKVCKRPARFFRKSRQSEFSDALLKKIEIDEVKKPEPKTSYEERELHLLFSYFVYATPSFSRGRNIFTKTIFHEKLLTQGRPGFLPTIK
jgi:hypothetical protein